MKDMRKQKFQGGGSVLDEAELFDDVDGQGGAAAGQSALANELIYSGEGADGGGEQGTDPATIPPAADNLQPGDDLDLTGVERFLTDYGVQGGVIVYEDGSTARFSQLDPDEQAEILSSLVKESVPSIEEKYNLDEDEVNLLNTLRESDLTAEEFINNLVDYRMQTVAAQMEISNTDYRTVSDDGIYVKHLRDTYEGITDEEIASDLSLAKTLPSYESLTETMREKFIVDQELLNGEIADQDRDAFEQDLENQRHVIVSTVEDIQEIGGARITEDMKEYLLHDIMELNENQDPLLMEKVFSSPEAMFKTNWFLTYGEDYIAQMNTYWKNEVSKARKEGYIQATSGMPGSPQRTPVVAGERYSGQRDNLNTGNTLTEEELFEETK